MSRILTSYRSAVDRRSIGFQVKGVQAIARRFGFDGLGVTSDLEEQENGEKRVVRVGIMPLLLGAFREEDEDPDKFGAYSEALRVAARVEDEALIPG